MPAAVCSGGAMWCSLGTVGTMGPPTNARVALLASWWLLPVLIAAAFATIRILRLSSQQQSPLFGSAIVILPWLPVPLPVTALMWTGPVIGAVWVLVFAGVIVTSLRDRHVDALADGRRAPIAAATLALAVYVVSAIWLSPILPDGDEPHYLILAQSLIKDGDLKIENNHRNGDYLAYSLNAAAPDYLRRGTNGEIYSIHAPGLAVLIAPAMWLRGYAGVVAFLAVIAALSTGLVWWLAFHITRSASAAWFGWGCCAITTPFLFQSTEVFPDGIAATCLLVGTLPLVEYQSPNDHRSQPWWIACVSGLALAILPWLQTRLAVLAVVAAICVCLRLRTARQFLAFAIVPGISAISWFSFFYIVYGTPNPTAPYGSYTQTSVMNLVRGIPGLLFDQQFGLIPNAPVYGFVLGGMLIAAIKLRRWGWETLALTVPYMTAVGSYQMWWGGTSVPARLLTPFTLILGVAGARAWEEMRRSSTRMAATLLLIVSFMIAAVLLGPEHGRLLLNFRDGISLWVEWVNDVVDLPKGLPSLFRDSAALFWLKVAIWALAISGAWVALRVIHSLGEKGESPRPVAWGSALWTGAIAVMIAFTLSWRVDGAHAITAQSSQLSLFSHAIAMRAWSYNFSGRRFQPTASMLSELRISTDRQRRPAASPVVFSARNVPAGVYGLGELAQSLDGRLTVHAGSQLPLLKMPASAAGEFAVLTLPAAIRSLTVTADGTGIDAEHNVELRPMSPLPSNTGSALQAVTYPFGNAFFLDADAYAEPTGFWVAGGRSANVILASHPEKPAVLLRNAPVEHHVRISIDGTSEDLVLTPGEERILTLPPTRRPLVLSITPERGFRPSAVDPHSTDQRYLGVWIEGAP